MADGASNDDLALRFAERYTYQATPPAKRTQSREFMPEAEDFDNHLLMGKSALKRR